jgi:hypothetical protein
MSTAGISVTLRGLTIYSSPGSPGTTGVLFNGGSDLTLENVKIFGFTSTGIKFTPSTSGSKLVVSDTTLSNNGNGSTGGGIVISPQSGGTAQVTLNRVTASKNVFGIVADGTGSTNGINMTIADSVSSGNSQDGIIAVTPSGGAPIGVYLKNTKSVNNPIGIRSLGPNVTVRVDGSSVLGNSTGLSFSGGGALLSAGNNMVQANGINGSFSGPAAPQ